MHFPVRHLDCCDCDQSFLFSSEDQGLSAELGYDQPTRCPACRRALETLRRSIAIPAALAWRRAAIIA